MGPAYRFAVDGDHALRHPTERSNPGDKAPLERLGVEHGEDVAEVVVCGCAVLERTKPTQKVDLLLPEQRDVDKGFGPGQHGQQA